MNRTKGNSGNEGSIPVHNLPNSDTITPSVHIYRFKNEALRETGLGSMRPLPVTPLPTNTYHRHNYYEILFFEEGQGFHEIDFHTFYFQSPSVHFVAPGTVHLLNPVKECRGYILAFTEDHYNFHSTTGKFPLTGMPFFKKDGKHESALPLDEKSRIYLKNILDNMAEDYLNYTDFISSPYLQIFLQKCCQLSAKSSLPPISPAAISTDLIGQFQELVEKHFRQQHEVRFYADILAVTPDYLSKMSKKHLDATAGEYIINKVLLEAKRLLVFSSLSSKEIAYHINIEDPSYFGRLFKRKTGLTPNEYRISVRKSTID